MVEMIESATSVDRVHDLMQDSYPTDVYYRYRKFCENSYTIDLIRLTNVIIVSWMNRGKKSWRK
jgi:hypothetical protein